MRNITFMVVSGLLGAAAFTVVVTGSAPEATAAKNPLKASVRCRQVIGTALLQVATAGLKAMDKCHALRLKGRSSGDCNSLSASSTYSRAKNRALARMRIACKDGDPVLQNYGGATNITQGFTRVFDVIQRQLEQSGSELLGAPTFSGDKKTVGKLRKCHGALGTGRTQVVQGILRSSFKCQQKIDKKAQSFGPIAGSCLAGAGGAGSKASKMISKACSAFAGSDVGSCDGLPGCLVSSAEKTAQIVARLTFGGPAVCGNALVDPGEACDDGNTVEDDGCTAKCQLPTCGDLSVNAPGEECDDPNPPVSGDDPSQNCYQCKLNVCGDGNLDTEEPRVEECDDGNDVPNDGCTNCMRDGTACGANGLAATLGLDYDEGLLGGVSGVRFGLSYPPSLSIPGTGNSGSVRGRVMNLLGSGFNLSMINDVDTAISLVVTTALDSIQPGPVVQVQFDCAQGTPVRPSDIPCELSGLTDLSGLPFAPEVASQARCTVDFEGGQAPSTTTTTVTPTTISPISTTTSTTPPSCGNGVQDPGEECDDGNLNPNDGCTSFCTICGNGHITAPESCDDGNHDGLDNCPADCRIEVCTPTAATQTITVVASRPDLTGVNFFLDYPDGRVDLPGVGLEVSDNFTDAAGTLSALDLDHAVSVNVAADFTFETTQLARATFTGCEGAGLPSAADYGCTVISASDSNFQDVFGVTCTVTIP